MICLTVMFQKIDFLGFPSPSYLTGGFSSNNIVIFNYVRLQSVRQINYIYCSCHGLLQISSITEGNYSSSNLSKLPSVWPATCLLSCFLSETLSYMNSHISTTTLVFSISFFQTFHLTFPELHQLLLEFWKIILKLLLLILELQWLLMLPSYIRLYICNETDNYSQTSPIIPL